MYLAIKVTYEMFITHVIIILCINYFKYTIMTTLGYRCHVIRMTQIAKCVTIITNSLNHVTLQCSQHQQIFKGLMFLDNEITC